MFNPWCSSVLKWQIQKACVFVCAECAQPFVLHHKALKCTLDIKLLNAGDIFYTQK